MNNIEFVTEVSKLRAGSTFLAVKGYHAESGEIADFSVVFNMSYTNALKRSIATLEAMAMGTALEREARGELLASWNKSLNNPEPVEEREPAYAYFIGNNDKPIRGVKLHVATDTLHIYGLLVHKLVRLPGHYKQVNSRPLTIAKKKLTSLCSVGKFRQFKVAPDQVDSINVQGLELLPPDTY